MPENLFPPAKNQQKRDNFALFFTKLKSIDLLTAFFNEDAKLLVTAFFKEDADKLRLYMNLNPCA